MIRTRVLFFTAAAALSLAACGDDNQQILDDAEREQQAIVAVKGVIEQHLDDFASATAAICAAAPAPDADGWNATADAGAVAQMKTEWKRARQAYEHVEGAIAVLFPDYDVSTDERYDGFIETSPDDNLFDDVGVIGVHAIERILWSDTIPAEVQAFESGLPNYKAASFPATEAEARDFKDKLCARLAKDASAMRDEFKPLALDASAAYRGVIGSLSEQVEKINLAATGEEESRYAQYTLGDMRANVEAGEVTYNAFRDWLLTKEGGADLDKQIEAGFGRLKAGYDALDGDALPPVPMGWSSEKPTSEQLETPFGQLFQIVSKEADTTSQESLVGAMLSSADKLGVDPL